jgi:hypothetical protein
MTWLWTALIAVGVVMIAVALWPSGRSRATPGEPADGGPEEPKPGS